MMRRLAALAVAACLTAGACSEGDDTSGVTTTSNPARPSSTTPSTGGISVTIVPATDATDEEILVGVAAGSVEGRERLPDEDWVDGVRRGCADLPPEPDVNLPVFLAAFRVQVEGRGATPAQSLDAVRALVGGYLAACPELGRRLEPLIPVS